MLQPWRNTSMVTESTRKGRSSVTICTTVAPPAVQPSSFWLGVRMVITAREGGPVHRCSVVAFDEAEKVLDAALIDVVRVNMPEVVMEEHLDRVRVLTKLGGDLRPASGYLSDLLGLLLLLLQLDLENCHVVHPINASPHPAVRLPPTLALWAAAAVHSMTS